MDVGRERGGRRSGPSGDLRSPGTGTEAGDGWEGAGQGRDAGRGMSAGVGREGAEQGAPLRPSGIQLKPEDWPVGKDGGIQGKTVVTSEALSFLPKQRRA